MTNTIKTIIVDDEINSIHNLEEDLKAYPEIEILDTITSSQKAKKVLYNTSLTCYFWMWKCLI